jgi:hypothetical protein
MGGCHMVDGKDLKFLSLAQKCWGVYKGLQEVVSWTLRQPKGEKETCNYLSECGFLLVVERSIKREIRKSSGLIHCLGK